MGKWGIAVEAAQFEIVSNKRRQNPLALATIFRFLSPSSTLLPENQI